MNYTCENCIFFENHNGDAVDGPVGICKLTGDIITVDFDCQYKVPSDCPSRSMDRSADF